MKAALRRRVSPALLVCAAGASCVETPPPQPVVPQVDVALSMPSAPPPLPARWIESGGATLVGPEIAGGTLVLLGGRRAIVKPGGALETERTPSPEPLLELVEVPSRGGGRLVGRGAHGVYRFDDALGAPAALARTEATLARLGAGPGVVALWTERSDLPRFLDVETGAERPLARLPEPPLRGLAFVDDKRGAGVFEAVGLAVTTDGGASWRVATGRARGDALAMNGVRRRQAARGVGVRAFAYADGPDAAVDLDRATLGPTEAPAPSPSEPAVLRWIHASGRDPLEAVAAGGVDLGADGALVASHGMIARVDPRTGALAEVVELAHGKWLPCSAARTGPGAWIACALADDAGKKLFDPFGVMRLTLADRPLHTDKPALLRNGEAELRVSPSGGAMLMAACGNDEQGQACVRQPDGAWRTIDTSLDLAERGAGPLADGRVAFLRGLFDGDDPPEPAGDDDEGAKARRLHVAALGPGGKERLLAPIAFTPSRGYVRVHSPIEEDLDRTLRLVIEDGDGPFAVVAAPGREAAPAQRVADAAVARIHAGHGIAVGEGHVLASTDGGSTWSEVPATPAALDAASAVATSYDEPDRLVVGELGAKVGSMLRLGWGPAELGPAAFATLAPGPLLAPVTQATPGRERVLACTSAGASPGTPPLASAAQARALFGTKPARPGARRESSVWSSGRAGMLDVVALFDEEGTDKPREPPAAWSFRWQDPTEIGGRIMSAVMKSPAGAGWGSSLRFAAAASGRALFVVRSAGKFALVRVKPSGPPEIADVPQDLVPSGEVVFGADKGEAIAWANETHVVAWLSGEAPRPIAELATHATRALGTPTRDGVPLLLGAADWSLLRTLPVPARDKGAAAVSLDGWARLPPLRSALGTLPPCGGRAKGARFTLARSGGLAATIDGAVERGASALYTIEIAGADACVARITATLAPDRRSGPGVPAPGTAAAGKPGAGTGFVRADSAGKRAEGGDRGVAPDASVKRMRCALDEKR